MGPGLTQNDLPGPLKNFLTIPIEVQDTEDRLNNAINQLAKALNLQQEFTKRRNYTLQEFSEALRAWQSKRPSPQSEIEQLKTQIQELERSHQQQLEELEAEITRLQNRLKYSQLEILLAAGKWREADQETQYIMLKVANRQGQHRLTVEDINNFPCEDLRTIDQLWLQYSNRHFGFSVQKEIYLYLGGTQNYRFHEQMWEEFGAKVGWRNEKDWYGYDRIGQYGLKDPRGHLPYHRKLDSWESIVLLYKL